MQFGINTGNNQEGNLPTSQSDNAIYVRSISNRDRVDSAREDLLDIHRSISLQEVVPSHVEFSEDDEQQFNNECLSEDTQPHTDGAEIGAARIRELPARKTTINSAVSRTDKQTKPSKPNQKTTTTAIRSRRKLRGSTPDIDVEME